MCLLSIIIHIYFIYFHLAFKSTTTIQQWRQQLKINYNATTQQQLNINDNATTQQQLDYAICMWYQSMKENRIVFRIKQRIKIRFSFLGSLRINTWISDSIVTSKCGIWKQETGISITAKQAASSRASSKSTRTVLLQNSVLAKESEVSES